MLSKKNQGFSLTELLIVVAILALLAAIAIPSYNMQIRKTRRADAKAALLELSQRQETYYADWNSYAATIVNLGWSRATDNNYYSKEDFYQLAITSASARAFVMTATAKGAQLKDTECRILRIDNTGAKTATDSTGADSTDCW